MSYEQENKQALVAYFKEGAKGDKPLGALGVEVEHIVLPRKANIPYRTLEAKGNLAFVMCWRIWLTLIRSIPMALRAT